MVAQHTWFLLLFCSNCLMVSIYTTSPFVKCIIICTTDDIFFLVQDSAECFYVMIPYFTCFHFYQRLGMMLLSQTVSNRNCSGWVENIHDEASNCEGFSIFRAFLIVKGVRKKVFVKHFFAWLIAENSFIPKLHTLQ